MISQINISSPSNEILYNDTSISNALDPIKSSSARVYWLTCDNTANSASTYIRLWNLASGSITNGTTPSDFVVFVPGLSIITINFGTAAAPGIIFGTALTASAVTQAGQFGATSPASAVAITVSYA